MGLAKKNTNKRARVEVDGDMCSTHNKKRKAEYLIDDGAGGMCCSPDDECKGSKEPGQKKECKWCEQGECWSHGQIEKPEGKKERNQKGKSPKEARKRDRPEIDGDTCSAHGKTRKSEFLIDDGEGGMCCQPGDECKTKESGAAAKPERKPRGKKAGGDGCKWCDQGECWSHGQIEKPAGSKPAGRNAGQGKKVPMNAKRGKGNGKGGNGGKGGGQWVFMPMMQAAGGRRQRR